MIDTDTKLRWNRRTIPGAAMLNRANPWVFIGDVHGLKKAARRPGSLVAPIDVDPELFRWPVADLEITLICSPETRVFADRVAHVLIREGAKLVVCCDVEKPARFWRR